MTINWKSLETEFKELINQILTEAQTATKFVLGDIFFSTSEDGFVSLSGKSYDKYISIFQYVINEKCKSGLMSKRFIEQQINKVILKTLDLNKKNPEISLDQKLQTFLFEFRNSIGKKSHDYLLYYPVHGLSKDGLPWKIGAIEFFVFQEKHLYELELKQKKSDSVDIKAFKQQEIEIMRKQNIFDSVFAKIKIKSCDRDAAEELAANYLLYYLDILNFFIGLIPYSNGFIYMPGFASTESIFSPIKSFEVKWTTLLRHQTVGPLSQISLLNLEKANIENKYGLRKLKRIIEKPNDLQKLILTSMRWAGKAWENKIRNRKEDSFLNYAIALESIILPDIRHELTYRLSIRLSHLLSKSKGFRFKNSKNIEKLYNLRGNIVHDGSCEISNANLSKIEHLARNAIIHIFRDKPFSSMQTIKDLVLWFENRILR